MSKQSLLFLLAMFTAVLLSGFAAADVAIIGAGVAGIIVSIIVRAVLGDDK